MKKFYLLLSAQLICAAAFAQSVPVGNANGQDYVDLGLPSHNLWATANVGATATDAAGDKYQWADMTALYKTSDNAAYIASGNYATEATTPYAQETNGVWGYTKYNATDGKTTLEATDDAVAQNMGGDWKMPTKADFEELIANTDQELVAGTMGTNEGGMYFYKKNDHSVYIFLPAAEVAVKVSYYECWTIYGHTGWYWSSDVDTNDYTKAYHLAFSSILGTTIYSSTRLGGRLLRGVLAGKEDTTTAINTVNNNSVKSASYNMFGQNATKGMVICNGKKMFIK